MVLALALWQTVSDTFANKAASGGNVVSENTIAVHEQTDAYIAMPQLPYLPDAELAGMGGQLHSLTYSRIQRISTTEYIFSLKDWIDKLAQRAAVLSLHREKLYDATAYYRCQPVCESSFFPCVWSDYVFLQGNTVFSISNKFIKTYYNYGNSNY